MTLIMPGGAEVLRLNALVTTVDAVMVKEQGLVMPHPPPLNETNEDPFAGTAARVTIVP